MPIKVLIMVIEERCSAPNVTKAPKGGIGWILCGFLVILGCDQWYFNSHFFRWCLASSLGVFRSYMMHAELVLLIENSCERFVTGGLEQLQGGSFKIPRQWLVVSA